MERATPLRQSGGAGRTTKATAPTALLQDGVTLHAGQWLADYAATGLPPAYLPKEETDL